jgi:hypothetical protein
MEAPSEDKRDEILNIYQILFSNKKYIAWPIFTVDYQQYLFIYYQVGPEGQKIVYEYTAKF